MGDFDRSLHDGGGEEKWNSTFGMKSSDLKAWLEMPGIRPEGLRGGNAGKVQAERGYVKICRHTVDQPQEECRFVFGWGREGKSGNVLIKGMCTELLLSSKSMLQFWIDICAVVLSVGLKDCAKITGCISKLVGGWIISRWHTHSIWVWIWIKGENRDFWIIFLSTVWCWWEETEHKKAKTGVFSMSDVYPLNFWLSILFPCPYSAYA